MLDAKQIAQIVRVQDKDAEVSPSTLHYYVQVGILPPAVGRGRSGYTPEHLSRFRLARRLKREGAGLADIRERLGRMTPGEVAAELAQLGAPAGQSSPAPLGQARLAAGPAPGAARARLAHRGPGGEPVLAVGEASALDDAATRYTLAAEALRARSGRAPRTLRFRGGFSLQVPAGASDEQIARLYTAIEAVLNEEEAR